MSKRTYTLKNIPDSIGGALLIVVTVLFSPLLRRWYNRWGATDHELKMALPGDLMVPHPKLEYTRAITINASPPAVWPWLAQLGYGRAAMYSYDWLENLIGCQMHSRDEIVPEFQHLTVGDAVRLGPPGYPLYRVEAIEPNHLLQLMGADPKTGLATEAPDPTQPSYANARWVFILEQQAHKTTRLIVRSRLDYYPNRLNWLIWRVFTEPIGFVMERKMLLGIKQRAEAIAQREFATVVSQVQ
jgi:hypothetical protein